MADGAAQSTENQSIAENVIKIKKYLDSKRDIIDAHNVDFFTQDLWEKCLPQELRNDLENLSEDQLAKLPSYLDSFPEDESKTDGRLNVLKEFLEESRSVQLRSFFCVEPYKDTSDVPDQQMPCYMMTPKKTHEVSVMGRAVNELAKKVNTTRVLDLGSGKGYLSQSLAMDYGLTVVGVDSKESNTQNAEKRNLKLLKAWNGILRNKKQNEEMKEPTNELNKDSCCRTFMSQETEIGRQNKGGDTPHDECSLNSCTLETGGVNDACVHMNPPLVALPNKSYSSQGQSQNSGPSYIPITKYIDISEFQSSKLFQELSIDNMKSDFEQGLVLVGLHTCGDLGPAAIKIFINDQNVTGLCLVGCCYHLLTQIPSESKDSQEFGFPLSECLRRQGCTLSRNATMVAQQAAAKMATLNKQPPRSIFYRAVLQVILKEKFQLDTSGQHVGKAGAKCKMFVEYTRKCLAKLELPGDIIQDEEILEYLERFQEKEWRIMAFHQLRASIAPSIESLFLMDRLCYLQEQGFHKSSIVCLFDPVKSPRCYAIIAAKESDST